MLRLFFFFFFRCGISGGVGLPPALGHPLLDQLHHLHHQPTDAGSEPSGRLQPAGRGHAVGGRPSSRVGPRRVSKVSTSTQRHLYGNWEGSGFKLWGCPVLRRCFSVFSVNLVFTPWPVGFLLVREMKKDEKGSKQLLTRAAANKTSVNGRVAALFQNHLVFSLFFFFNCFQYLEQVFRYKTQIVHHGQRVAHTAPCNTCWAAATSLIQE